MCNPDALIDRMNEASLSNDCVPNFQAITSFLDNELDRFNEVVKFPIHFYEDGIDSLKASFIMKQTIAMERWNGDTNYSFKDVMNMIFNTTW